MTIVVAPRRGRHVVAPSPSESWSLHRRRLVTIVVVVASSTVVVAAAIVTSCSRRRRPTRRLEVRVIDARPQAICEAIGGMHRDARVNKADDEGESGSESKSVCVWVRNMGGWEERRAIDRKCEAAMS